MNTLNLEQAAAFLNASETRVQEMAQRGDLPGAKVGRGWVFLESRLVEWLDQETDRQMQQRTAERPVTAKRSLKGRKVPSIDELRGYAA